LYFFRKFSRSAFRQRDGEPRFVKEGEHVSIHRRVRIGIAFALDAGIGRDQLVVKCDPPGGSFALDFAMMAFRKAASIKIYRLDR
jgi:hypothetical protein